MTWRWAISFSLGLCLAMPARAGASAVSGAVEITNSKEPAVRRNKNYSGVVIWLERTDGAPVSGPPKQVKMLQQDRHFVPHVLAISTGSTVDFPNLDPIFHNAFSNFSGQPFDTGLYPPGTTRLIPFKLPGIVRVFCNIHPTMSAIIAVLPTPWYDVTKTTGKYQIANVPPGEYQIRIFYERALPENLKFLERRVTVGEDGLQLPLISISETGYIPVPHLNKYGHTYPRVTNEGGYPGSTK
jgi:plastocyanin